MGLAFRASLGSILLPKAYCGLDADADDGRERRASAGASSDTEAALYAAREGLGKELMAVAGLTGIILSFAEESRMDALARDARVKGVAFASFGEVLLLLLVCIGGAMSVLLSINSTVLPNCLLLAAELLAVEVETAVSLLLGTLHFPPNG